jgi:hypothetical protein
VRHIALAILGVLAACDFEPCPSDCSGAARDVIALCEPGDKDCAVEMVGPEIFAECQIIGGPSLDTTLDYCAANGQWSDACDLEPLDFVETQICAG